MGKKRGLLISFEGGEAVGKSTQIDLLSERLAQFKVPHLKTREPGGTTLGEQLRKIFKSTEMDALTELFLIEGARRDHVEKKIKPALKKGKIILCDRFQESSLVYQSRSGLPLTLVRKLNRLATDGLKSDLIFLLHLKESDLKKRLEKRKEQDRFDQANISFHRQIGRHYQQLAKQARPAWIVLDASEKPEMIHEKIFSHVAKKLGLKLDNRA